MKGNQPVYRSFLLRFWHEKGTRETTLRAIVVDTQTGERQGFNSFDALTQFLKGKIDRRETQCPIKEEAIEENE
jgi:hypothetical protein